MNEISKFESLFNANIYYMQTDALTSRTSTLHCDIVHASANARDIKFSCRKDYHKYQHDVLP